MPKSKPKKSSFKAALKKALKASKAQQSQVTQWYYLPYDQLQADFGPMSEADPKTSGVILIESSAKAARRPYHKQKLALLLANMRNFAIELAQRGFFVLYWQSTKSYATALEKIATFVEPASPIVVQRPAERELRVELESLPADLIAITENQFWLTTQEQFKKSQKKLPFRMDSFYRHIRKQTGLLMEGKKYAGGKLSHDGANRERWDGKPKAATPPTFEVNEITQEVIDLVNDRFARHPGDVIESALPATASDAEALLSWVEKECMKNFGPYEDAMHTKSTNLFHTRLSALINLGRIWPQSVIDRVKVLDIPINSKEGFIRQVIGWREFVHHIHDLTDGFRNYDSIDWPITEEVGDGGFQTWSGEKWCSDADLSEYKGSNASYLNSQNPLPPAFWGTESGLFCLDHVVKTVWDEAYAHHIPRLMVLSNFGALLDVSPRELTDWFWVAFHDAFDWVVEPNVLGMGTFAVGDLMTTKPYVSGGAYINKMSDFCSHCQFDVKSNCPVTRMYWAFLGRHEEELKDNPRLRLPLSSLNKRSEGKVEIDRRVYEHVSESLSEGRKLQVADLDSIIK